MREAEADLDGMGLPSLFVSHGSPMLPFDDCPARDFLRGLGREIGRPRAIVVASAHWDTQDEPHTNAVAENATIHDFYGFPRPLYELRYAAPGDAALAGEIASRTGASVDRTRGLDHGAWIPLALMYPAADIPVVQLSVQSLRDAAQHMALGRALSDLRADNVLVMGSGGFVHNLRALDRSDVNAPTEPEWSRGFADWTHDRLMARDAAALTDWRARAPHAAIAHPTPEHFLPLFVAYGAGGEKTTRLHSSATYGSLRMDAYAFG
jgi:4,5-DOPA dioxygenase extradiol